MKNMIKKYPTLFTKQKQLRDYAKFNRSKQALLKTASATLSLTIALSSTVFASSFENRLKAEHAGRLVTQAFQLILDNYIGDVTAEQLYNSAMIGLSYPLDEYSYYLGENDLGNFMKSLSGEMHGIGITFNRSESKEFSIVEILENTPAYEAGLKSNDIIISVNNISTKDLSMDDFVEIIKEATSAISFIVTRDGKNHIFEITPREISLKTVVVKKFEDLLDIDSGIDNSNRRYMELNSFSETTDEEFKNALIQLHADGVSELLIDFRGNSGGYLDVALSIGKMIVPSGVIISTVNNDGTSEVFTSSLSNNPFEKIVVLTDENTASAAELIASALQDAGVATIVGEQTFGKGVMQTVYTLGYSSGMKLTNTEYFRRNGEKINTIGVIPDIEIKQPHFINNPIILNNSSKSDKLPVAKEILEVLGYDVGEINDHYNEETFESVKVFQESKGLNTTGFMDIETIDALNFSLRAYILENDPVLLEAYNIFINL